MGAHGSKEKLHRSASERFVHTQVIERERFGSFGKRPKKEGKKFENLCFFCGRTSQMFRVAYQNKLTPAATRKYFITKKTRLRSLRANFWVNVKGYDLMFSNERQF